MRFQSTLIRQDNVAVGSPRSLEPTATLFESSSKRRRATFMKANNGHFKDITGSRQHMLGTQLFKALVLPAFTYGTEILRGKLKKSHWKVFEKGMMMHRMSHVEMRSSITYHILLAEFKVLSMELALSNVLWASNNGSPTYPPLG